MDKPGSTQAITPRFELQRLYVKEQSCKLPHAPAIFQDEWKPEIQLEMNIKQEALAAPLYEVNLRLSITAKNQQRTAFALDVQQAGIFLLEEFTEEQRNFMLQAHCPGILYPYARKVVADAVYAAGFPPLVIAPINFEGLYHQQQTQAAAENATAKPVEMSTPAKEKPTH